jgi:hypothetical protein
MNIQTKNTKPINYTPGMIIVVRDAEWVVRKSDPTVDGGYLIECQGKFTQLSLLQICMLVPWLIKNSTFFCSL